jgi:hypothetical protein
MVMEGKVLRCALDQKGSCKPVAACCAWHHDGTAGPRTLSTPSMRCS